jgi:hypothetical protein
MTTPEPQKEQMTTQTKTETPDNGQSELERLANTSYISLLKGREPYASDFREQEERIILTALTTAADKSIDCFIHRLLTEFVKHGVNTDGWDGEDTPEQIIAGRVEVWIEKQVDTATAPLKAEIERVNGFRERLAAKYRLKSDLVAELKTSLTAALAKIREIEAQLDQSKP